MTLSDPLPSGTASPWAISSQPAGSPCSITGSTLSCAFGDLAPGASETVEVTAATTFADCTVYDNTATASSANAPNDSDDGEHQLPEAQPERSARLRTPRHINAGENIVFDVTVSNAGPGYRQGGNG